MYFMVRKRLVYCLKNVVLSSSMQCLTTTNRGRIRYTVFKNKGSLNTSENENTHLSVKLLCVSRTVMIKYIFLLFAEQNKGLSN